MMIQDCFQVENVTDLNSVCVFIIGIWRVLSSSCLEEEARGRHRLWDSVRT